MPNLCSVCESPALRAIDDLILADRRSLRSIADAFALGYKAVQRHAANHVGPRGRQGDRAGQGDAAQPLPRAGAPDAPGEPQGGESPVELMRSIVASLRAVDAATLSPSAQVSHFDSFRRAVEALARMEPPATPGAIGVWEIPGMGPFFADALLTMERFPEARLALSEMLKRHDYQFTAETE